MNGSNLHALLVILGDDYGDPRRGLSFEVETFVPSFRNLFDLTTVFPFDRWIRDVGFFAASSILEQLVRETRPSLVFVVPFEHQVDWLTLRRLKHSGVPTIAWMCDDHWRYENFSQVIAGNFTAVATTDRFAFAKYHAVRDVKPILTQWAVPKERLRRPDSQRDIAVSFIGACRPHRERMVKSVRSAGIPVLVRGSGWPEGRASSSELVELPARSRISLNFSDSSTRHARGKSQLKARPFELAASGTCVVTEVDPQMSAYLRPGIEVAEFVSRRQLVACLKDLLNHDDRRAEIAWLGYRRVENEHTLEKRLCRVFEQVGVDVTLRESIGELCITK